MKTLVLFFIRFISVMPQTLTTVNKPTAHFKGVCPCTAPLQNLSLSGMNQWYNFRISCRDTSKIGKSKYQEKIDTWHWNSITLTSENPFLELRILSYPK